MTTQRPAARAARVLILSAGALAAASLAAAATLSPEAVAEKLSVVPVFVLTNAEGAPLSANDGTTGIYLDREGAVRALEGITARQADVGKATSVAVVPLTQVVPLLAKTSPIHPIFVGTEAERAAAAELRPKGSELGSAAPVFLLRGASGFVVLKKDDVPYMPVFFSSDEAKQAIAHVEKSVPGGGVRLEVAALERMLQLLVASEDAGIAQMRFIPSASMLEGARAASAAMAPPAAAPATPPAATAPRPAPRMGR